MIFIRIVSKNICVCVRTVFRNYSHFRADDISITLPTSDHAKYDNPLTNIDANLWLKLRLMLCVNLLYDDSSGGINDHIHSLKRKIGNLEVNLEQVFVECRIFNNGSAKIHAEFIRVKNELNSGGNTENIILQLEV